MVKHTSLYFGLALLATLAGAACSSQKTAEQQKKVDELQAQLDAVKKELAANSAAAAPAEAPPAAATPAAPASAPAPAPAPAVKNQPPPVTAEQGRKAKEALEKQQALNLQQAATNERVQTQIEDLKSREYTIPSGTVIPIRTTTELSTSKLSNGSVFEALLERSLTVGGETLAAKGARVTGMVVSSDEGGRVKGVAGLVVTIRQIAGVRDQTIRVTTSNYAAEAESTKGRDAKRTAIMTGVGAAIGAIAGGGKGAAIGAGGGAAVGVGTNAATKGAAAVIPAETLIEFTLTTPATVVVRR